MSDFIIDGLRPTRALFIVTFNDRRVGRCFNVGPLTARAADADDLAQRIWHYVAACVVSGTCDIQVDLANKSGVIYEGVMTIAKFTIVEVGRASR